ncbi:hypothetical protein TREMEDRAFT_25751 [Tremella mesenterica DSM 1558]|uniref:uncharacterized protein n=1 Tax=Tremella mesenterica (strain ATCC 24925 / CBS 8224 / DSM 1558 / NBRC 9311 / NRRL Y-6157 / RJB 2259-6 / UBC 559-6) TaxID=578456 RepID=UPI0003F49625|nr:uncharacterized protein TREMEDRAFT_25751 [Tremella mesenterica DSM 1558]EIW72794.1 hypothetical protein TREMEDRAFT_25751 [Tremella mesenterica DSM 1558]
MSANPLLPPMYLPGQEPMPPGTTPQEREEFQQMLKYQKMMGTVMESCPLKVVMAGGAGFLMGGFFSLMSATFAYEDPLSRASRDVVGTRAQTAYVFKEMGKSMWRSGRGFAKVGALYSGVECGIEGYRAKNDLTNAVSAGFVTGAILARNSGPVAMAGGGAAFAGFSAVIDWWLRRPPAEEI